MSTVKNKKVSVLEKIFNIIEEYPDTARTLAIAILIILIMMSTCGKIKCFGDEFEKFKPPKLCENSESSGLPCVQCIFEEVIALINISPERTDEMLRDKLDRILEKECFGCRDCFLEISNIMTYFKFRPKNKEPAEYNIGHIFFYELLTKVVPPPSGLRAF